jgi:flagellin FlaB
MIHSKKGEMAMGTLIIFIALVLIAAVAASVLIQTTGTLQNKALSTGKATTTEVGTSLKVMQITGENGSDEEIETFTVAMKLNSGSDPIRFEDLLITFDLNEVSRNYQYNSNGSCSNVTSNSDFFVTYTFNGTNHKDGYLTKGDVVDLCFNTTRPVQVNEKVRFNFFPKTGTSRVIETHMPELILTQRVPIFP